MKTQQLDEAVNDDFVRDFNYILDKKSISNMHPKIVIKTALEVFFDKYFIFADGEGREYLLPKGNEKLRARALQKQMSFA